MDSFLKLFFSALSLTLIGVMLYAGINRTTLIWSPLLILCLFVLPGAWILAALWSLVSSKTVRINLLIATLAFVLSVYFADLGLMLAGPYITLPAEFDRRSKLDVVLDLRKQHRSAMPSIHPKDFIKTPLLFEGEVIMPLSSVSSTTTVFCNETGKYYIFESDEHGFTNPKGRYPPARNRLALIGDSFTQGFCAPDGTGYAERLRSAVPETINLGNNGNGPLVELATLRELPPAGTPSVLWFYFEGNDPEDLSRELQNPILTKYLTDKNFTQHLSTRQTRVDLALQSFIEDGIAGELKSRSLTGRISQLPEQLKLWATLWHLRALMGINDVKKSWPLHRWNHQSTREQVDAALRSILKESRDIVASWGGRLTVIYLPSFRNFGYGVVHPWRQRSLEIFQELNLPVLDLLPIFQKYPDPAALFAYRKEGHYTAEGNRVVSDAVLKYLTETGQLSDRKS